MPDATTQRTKLPFFCLLMGLVSLPTFLTLLIPAGTIALGVWTIGRVQQQGGSVRANIITMLGMSLAGVALLYGVIFLASGLNYNHVLVQFKLQERQAEIKTASDFLESVFTKQYEQAYQMLDRQTQEHYFLEAFVADHKDLLKKNGWPEQRPLYAIVEITPGAWQIVFDIQFKDHRRKIKVVVKNNRVLSTNLLQESEAA